MHEPACCVLLGTELGYIIVTNMEEVAEARQVKVSQGEFYRIVRVIQGFAFQGQKESYQIISL